MTTKPPAPTALDVLRHARSIVADGGDPHPCEFGCYCLRCCIGIAKTDLDRQRGSAGDVPWEEYAGVWLGEAEPTLRPSDAPLVEARDRIGKYDKGVKHTRESALALLDKVIREYAP